jgi:cytochrome c oxidase subunit 2
MNPPTRHFSAPKRVALSWLLLPLAALLLLAAAGPAWAEEGGAGNAAAANPKLTRYAMGWVPLPPNNSVGVGQEIDHIFYVVLWLTVVVWILTQSVMIWFMIKYRERPGVERKIVYSHGSNNLEAIWTAIPAVIVLVLALWSEIYWAKARKNEPKEAEQIKVIGKQFNWDIIYAGEDGDFKTTADNVQTNNLLLLPVGRPTVFTISSRDVLHSFFLPDFRLKQDAVPGAEIKVWVTPQREGKYEIACAEFCGISHGQMRGTLEVLNETEYRKRLESMKGVSLSFE